ncbi:MAG: phage tail protein [Chloroflexi bacterium]|nr:phage tail protein [Chloroflexota bacterium]
MSEPFLAEIIMFGGNFAPRGWALCDGQLLPISQYSAVFSLLGTTYGGDGRTTFGLPDMRGRVPVHPGTGPGLTPRRLGESSGTEHNTLSVNQMPSHTHATTTTATTSVPASTNSGTKELPAAGDFLAAGNVSGRPEAQIYIEAANAGTTVDLSAGATVNVTVVNTGNGQQVNNMQPWLGVNFIIALEGTFPSRN